MVRPSWNGGRGGKHETHRHHFRSRRSNPAGRPAVIRRQLVRSPYRHRWGWGLARVLHLGALHRRLVQPLLEPELRDRTLSLRPVGHGRRARPRLAARRGLVVASLHLRPLGLDQLRVDLGRVRALGLHPSPLRALGAVRQGLGLGPRLHLHARLGGVALRRLVCRVVRRATPRLAQRLVAWLPERIR